MAGAGSSVRGQRGRGAGAGSSSTRGGRSDGRD